MAEMACRLSRCVVFFVAYTSCAVFRVLWFVLVFYGGGGLLSLVGIGSMPSQEEEFVFFPRTDPAACTPPPMLDILLSDLPGCAHFFVARRCTDGSSSSSCCCGSLRIAGGATPVIMFRKVFPFCWTAACFFCSARDRGCVWFENRVCVCVCVLMLFNRLKSHTGALLPTEVRECEAGRRGVKTGGNRRR